jgi:vitamin B12 transporter
VLPGDFKVSANLFRIEGEDKIIWIPTRLALQVPRNAGEILSKGAEIIFGKSFFNETINLNAAYNLTDVKNKTKLSGSDNSYNKQLVYTPVHRINFNGRISYDDFTFSFYTNFTGERFYTSDNNPAYSLPEFFIADASASYNLQLFQKKHLITFSVYNLFNEEYLLIQSYPMPLRSYLLSINMELM